MKIFFLLLQAILAIFLCILILMQAKGTGLGRAFGGFGGTYSSKRGVEKVVFHLTIVLAALFFVASIIRLLYI